MKILAIEQSTATGSLALLEDSLVLGQDSWTELRGRAGNLIAALGPLMAASDVAVEQVDLFAVGLGPGSFAGLRASLSAANALALPGRKPVVGIASAMAMARNVMIEKGVDSVTVVGDARRKRLWHAGFMMQKDAPLVTAPFSLIEYDELAAQLAGSTIVATPDWDRLEELLRTAAPDIRLVDGPRVPDAAAIGQLAAITFDPARPSAPPEPIYMHPPVFVKPGFSPPS